MNWPCNVLRLSLSRVLGSWRIIYYKALRDFESLFPELPTMLFDSGVPCLVVAALVFVLWGPKLEGGGTSPCSPPSVKEVM